MRTWKQYCSGLALVAGLTPVAWSQTPQAALPAPADPVIAPVPDSSKTHWSFFAACKARWHQNHPASNGDGSGLANPDLAKPADTPEGSVARIKQDESAARVRCNAIRYLATVDCRYWPEAHDAMLTALRADRSEMVRLEAATALRSGCCCTKAAIKALTITITGSDEDGNPAEASERVRLAARAALQQNLAFLGASSQPTAEASAGAYPLAMVASHYQPAGAQPAAGVQAQLQAGVVKQYPCQAAGYYKHIDGTPLAQLVQQAQVSLAATPGTLSSAAPVASSANVQSAPAVASAVPLANSYHAERETAYDPSRAGQQPAAATLVAQQPPAVPTSSRPDVNTVVYRDANGQPVGAVPGAPTADAACSPAGGTSYTSSPAQSYPGWPAQQPGGAADLRTVQVHPASGCGAPLAQASQPTRPEANGSTDSQKLVNLLRSSIYPEEREWAVQSLGKVDWRTKPEALEALLTAAREDPVPTVRAAAVRCLARMNANTVPVLNTLQELKADTDPRVQYEAYEALARLNTTHPQ